MKVWMRDEDFASRLEPKWLQGRIQNFMKRRGCFTFVLGSGAKLAHAHYRLASGCADLI